MSEDFDSNESRKAEAYEIYEAEVIDKDKISFEDWVEEMQKHNDDQETKEEALRDTHN